MRGFGMALSIFLVDDDPVLLQVLPETVAMKISGHKTRSVFDRYNITSEEDLREAASRLARYIKKKEEEVTFSVIVADVNDMSRSLVNRKVVEIPEIYLEPASGIEPPTCGLRIS